MDAMTFKYPFKLRPLVICDSCNQALHYVANEQDFSEILQHPNSDCARSGQKFKAPTMELERIPEPEESK